MNERIQIFKKVHCKAYMKKQSDGVRLVCTKIADYGNGLQSELPVEGSVWNDTDKIRVVAKQEYYENRLWQTRDLADLSNFEGDSVEKRYRFRIEDEFDGFLVGITNVIVTGRIGTDYGEEHMDCHDRYFKHLFKETATERVGVVYFKNNAKRYVLIDDMEPIE